MAHVSSSEVLEKVTGRLVPTSSIEEEKPTGATIPTPIKPDLRLRPSDPFKRIPSGLVSTGPDIVGLAGLAGAGLETLLTGPKGDRGFVDEFKENISEGLDRDLLNAGVAGRKDVQKTFGLPGEAKSAEDQVGELLGALVLPVPNKFLGSGVVGKAATFLAPTVRLGPKGAGLDKGFAARAGTQFGAGTAIDQFIRSESEDPDFPTILSEEALGHEPGLPSLSIIGAAEAKTVSTSTIQEEGTGESIPTADITEEKPGRIAALEELDRQVKKEEDSKLVRNIAIGTASVLALFLGAKASARIGANKVRGVTSLSPVERAEGLKAAADSIRRSKIERGVQGLKATGEEAIKIVRGKGRRLFGDIVDKTKHNEEHLRAVGVAEDQIKEITGQELVDTHGVVIQFLRDGKFGQGSGAAVRSLKSIRREYDALTPEDQQKFIDGVAFHQEDIARIRGTAFDALKKDKQGVLGGLRTAFETGSVDDVALVLREQADLIANIRGTRERTRPGLYNIRERTIKVEGQPKVIQEKVFIEDATLREGLKEFNSNAQFVQLQKGLARMNDAVLSEAVRRGAADKAWADAVRKQFTKDGNVLYLPGREDVAQAAWYKRLAVSMGFHSTTGKQLNGVANWHMKGLVEGEGIQSPLDPFQATANYTLQVMEHVNRSVKQWNILSRLSGIDFDNAGGVTINPPKIADQTQPTKYVGSSSMDDPLNQAGQIHVEFNSADKVIAERFGTKAGATFTPQQLAQMDDVIWVQRGSTYHGFLVADRQLKKALEFDAGLHNQVLKFGNFWKNTFTKFTTGEMSTFGVTSFIYNQQIATFNAALRASAVEGATIGSATREALNVWKDSYKGAYEIFSTNMASDFSDLLGQALSQREIYKSNPRLLRQIQVALKKKVRNTLMAPQQRETGKTASGLGAKEFVGDLTNIMEEAVPHISKTYGANVLPQFWRVWQHLNTAMHEGTALGISMRKSYEAAAKNPKASTSNLARQARRDANDLVGDVRLRGSSDLSKAFHAVTPFSGAMFAAWSTTTRAMRKAGLRKSIGTLTAAIGMPTVLEIVYNSSLDGEETYTDDAGKVWNYRDYFWNGFTTDQRNNNHIIMKPGFPPWEAVLIPVTPELSLFRGIVIDSMDAIFGFSQSGIDNGNQTLAGLVRVFDIPLNPFLAAVGSGMQLDLRAGVIPDNTEGLGFSFFKGRPVNTFRRIGGIGEAGKFEGSELSVTLTNVLQDIFGAAGTTSIGFIEGLGAGNETTPLSTRLGFAFDEVGRNIKRQQRLFPSIFGKVLRPSPDRDVARDLVSKRDALQRWASQLEVQTSGGTSKGGVDARGNTLSASADPVAILLSANADTYLKTISAYNGYISELRNEINKLGTATRDIQTGEVLTVQRREDIIDAMNLRIGAYQAQQLAELEKRRLEFIKQVETQVGKDISDFQFDTFDPRPTPSGLASPGLPK